MVRFFLRFLRDCYGVSDSDVALTVNVHLGAGRSIDEVTDWWLSALSLPLSSLRAPTVNRPSRASVRKRRTLPTAPPASPSARRSSCRGSTGRSSSTAARPSLLGWTWRRDESDAPRDAAVDGEGRSRDVAGAVRAEEGDGGGDVLDRAEAGGGDALPGVGLGGLARPGRVDDPVGGDAAGVDGVERDAVRGDATGEDLEGADHARAVGVGELEAVDRLVGREALDGDDPAPAALAHAG